jgi:hypothetical protein
LLLFDTARIQEMKMSDGNQTFSPDGYGERQVWGRKSHSWRQG